MENYTSKGTMIEYSINLDNMVYQKIMHWIDKAVGEVSGLGKLTIDKSTGLIEIKSAILLKQENTGTTTDIDAQSIAKAMFEMRNDEGHLNFWWHSHVNMGVFWSGTDLDTIREIGQQGFLVATVFNKKREMLSCLYRKGDDFFPETFINELPTQIVDYIKPELIAQWDTDFNEKCKAKVYVPMTGGAHLTDSFYGHDFSDSDMPFPNDWYKDYATKPAQHDFQFDDQGIPSITDDAKIYAVAPELVVIQEEMLKQETSSKAKHFLYKICNRVNKLKIQDKSKSYAFKQTFIRKFNEKFPNKGETNEAV